MLLLTDESSQDATPNLTPALNLKIKRRGSSNDMVYATVVGDNVEALLGFDVISTYLRNLRKATCALQRHPIYYIASAKQFQAL